MLFATSPVVEKPESCLKNQNELMEISRIFTVYFQLSTKLPAHIIPLPQYDHKRQLYRSRDSKFKHVDQRIGGEVISWTDIS